MELTAEEAASLFNVPVELLNAAALEAESDADRVVDFFEALRETSREEYPNCQLVDKWRTAFPARFLRELGAALRILEWEKNGVISPEMELQPARENLCKVLGSITRECGEPALSQQVTRAFVKHFAWNARAEIGGSVLLDSLNEEQVAEAIAHFLLNHQRSKR